MEQEIGNMLKSKKLFLLDIDGTVELGEQLLPDLFSGKLQQERNTKCQKL